MNSFAILLFIGMITCFLEGSLVVMLVFGLTFVIRRECGQTLARVRVSQT